MSGNIRTLDLWEKCNISQKPVLKDFDILCLVVDCIHLSPSVKCIWNAITNWPRGFSCTCLYACKLWKKFQSPKRSIEKYLKSWISWERIETQDCISTAGKNRFIILMLLTFSIWKSKLKEPKCWRLATVNFLHWKLNWQLTCPNTTSQ